MDIPNLPVLEFECTPNQVLYVCLIGHVTYHFTYCRKNKLLLACFGSDCYCFLGDWGGTLDHCGNGSV